MTTQAHAWVAETDWGRELIEKLKADAQKEGLQKGLRKGIAEGISQGIAQGIAEGIAQGHDREVANQARTLLTVLETTGIAVDDAARDRINACTDTDQLSEWIVRAVTASSIGEVLA